MMEDDKETRRDKDKARKRGRQDLPPLHPEMPMEEGGRAGEASREAAPGRQGARPGETHLETSLTMRPQGPGLRPAGQEGIFPGSPPRGRHALRAKDVMTEDPVCCTPDASLQRVARLMVENACGVIPVVRSRDDRIPVGILTDRDIALRTVALGRNPLELHARDVETPLVATVDPDATVEECLVKMREHRVRRLIVVDSGGRVCGLVSRADLDRGQGQEKS